MATALITVEEEVTCSVCFEVYRDPHVLRCLHTFCLPCIQQLDRGGRVECPQCRKNTMFGNIIGDFKTQSLIDKVKKHGDPVVISSKKCGMCENNEKCVKYFCKECNYFLCDSCEKMHRKIKMDKPHKVTTISDLIQGFQKKMETSVKELEDELKHIDELSDNITQNIELVNKSTKNQIQQVHNFTVNAKKKLEENEKRLTKLIEDINKNLVRNLTQEQQIYTNSKLEIEGKIKLLTEMIQSQDFQTLKDNAENINENIKEQIKKIKASLPEVDEIRQSPVTVKRNDSWNVKDFIQVKVDGDYQHNGSDAQVEIAGSSLQINQVMPLSKPLYSRIYRTKWDQTNIADTGHQCFKICEINNEIWCGGENMITIYNKQCQMINTIKHVILQGIRSLTLYNHNNQVILACQFNGLHSFNTHGQYLKCIMLGGFSDVSVQGDNLYVLQYGQCKVIVFKYTQQQWEKIREIPLKYGAGHEGHDCDRLCVTNTSICVSSYRNNHIYMYNTEGKLLQDFTNGKTVLLCDVDQDGGCLTAGYNHSVYLVQNNTWIPFSLKGQKLLLPFHAFVDSNGNLWVGTIRDELAKYRPSS